MTIHPTTRHETGAILPIFALMLLMLLIFAAFAVDLGAAWAERREAQTAADAGVMSAALQYLDSTPDEDKIYELVTTYVNSNVNAPGFSDSDWDGCEDDSRPTGYDALWEGTADEVECISIKQLNNEPAILRVRLPVNDVPTSFARLIGIDAIPVTAFAEAEILYLDQSAILPFSLPSNPSTNECLGTPPTGLLPNDAAPCTGPAQGNFGMIDSPWFGAGAPYGTDTNACPHDPNFAARTPLNLALGLDHVITSWPGSTPDNWNGPAIGTDLGNNHPDADSCDSTSNELPPHVLLTEPGNTQTGSAIMNSGFLGGPFGTPLPGDPPTPGRLRQMPAVGVGEFSGSDLSSQRLDLRDNTDNLSVDNVGLWEYLAFDKIDPSSSCDKGNFTGKTGRDLTDQMKTCLVELEGSAATEVFTDALLESPRFALVPVLNYVSGAQYGNKWWAVMELRPVYIQTTWYTCKSPTGECLFQPEDFDTYVPPNPTVDVTLTSPSHGTPVSGDVTVSANATTTANGTPTPTIDEVEFFVDGSSIKTFTTPPYSYSMVWDSTTVSDGTVLISATATDTAGNTGTHTIAVIVDNDGLGGTLDPPVGFGKSVFFNPGEGTDEPCLVKNGACSTPGTLTMAGSSAFVIGSDWLSAASQSAIGTSSPYEVFLRR